MGDDPELDELISLNRRRAGLRLLVVGVVVGLIGAGILLYGQSLGDDQANSKVKFELPVQIAFAGGIALAIGALLVVVAAVALVRSRKPPRVRD